MPDPKSEVLDRIPTYLPLDQAARKYGLSEMVLTQQIQAGKIEAVRLPTGELLVAGEKTGQESKTKAEIIGEKFAHLLGQVINAYEAQQLYQIHPSTFIRWARSGYIKIVNEEKGRLVEMDAADVAYCVYVYNKKKEEYGGRISGVKIFDEKGNPYQIKYPDLSVLRRKQPWLDEKLVYCFELVILPNIR